MTEDREPQESAALRFPRPRKREAPSPYRSKVIGSSEALPAEKTALVVRRPEPPSASPVRGGWGTSRDETWTGGSAAPPVPWGLADRLFARLRPLRDLVSTRPHVVLLLLVVVYAIVVRVWAESLSRYHSYAG